MTPHERLERIIAARTPSVVVFRPVKISDNTLLLAATKIKEASNEELPEDAALQAALTLKINELWDPDTGKYYFIASVDTLWESIKRIILDEYEKNSRRCSATKRKTELFIRGIRIDDKHLSNYLIQVFLKINSDTYQITARQELQTLFEQFESLRKTYGKRN